MFISKKELEEIRKRLADNEKKINSLHQAVSSLKANNKEQSEKIKELIALKDKKYVSQLFEGKSEEEQASIVDEWLNGAKEGDK